MRYAILTDIHGNSIALDAVLAQIGTVDAYLFLGDYCAIGADPIGVLERISKLTNAYFVKGNTDHYICNHVEAYPPPDFDDALNNPDKLRILAEIHRLFSWTQGMITAAGYFDWLEALAVEIRLKLPNGATVLMVHAAPREMTGSGMLPIHTDEDLGERFACDEDIILVGHTHWPQERRVNGKHIINAGSVGNPLGVELVARYAILEADENSYSIQFHQAQYDVAAVLRQIENAHHPTADYLAHFYKGEFIPEWYQEWKRL